MGQYWTNFYFGWMTIIELFIRIYINIYVSIGFGVNCLVSSLGLIMWPD